MQDLRKKALAENCSGFTDIYLAEEVPLLRVDDGEKLKNQAKKKKLFLVTDYSAPVGIFKHVAEGKGAFAIETGQLVRSRGVRRSILLGKMRSFLQFCRKFKAQYLLCTLAERDEDTRAAEELVAIGEFLGLSKEQAMAALERLGEYAKEPEEKSAAPKVKKGRQGKRAGAESAKESRAASEKEAEKE